MIVEIDLTILPEKARRELLDFYHFLVSKYGTVKDKKKARFEKLISNPVKVDKITIPSRDELHGR